VLHHVSFNAHDTDRVAAGVADLLDAQALRAPSPPFPRDAWFVCLGDDNGSLIEVMPWGETRDGGNARGVGHDAEMRPTTGSHILASTPRSTKDVLAIAERYGWRAEHAEGGMFRFIKVWVEGGFLLELLTPELKPAYVNAFNAEGMLSADRKLRELERQIAAMMAKA
jgi:hypothetical protein